MTRRALFTRPHCSEAESAGGEDDQKGSGYRYFGAAKQLPGVKELFEKQAPRTVRRTRHQMNKAIDADYYGFRDEEDGILAKEEAIAEEEMVAMAVLEWEAKVGRCRLTLSNPS
jgi:hypothetical protein